MRLNIERVEQGKQPAIEAVAACDVYGAVSFIHSFIMHRDVVMCGLDLDRCGRVACTMKSKTPDQTRDDLAFIKLERAGYPLVAKDRTAFAEQAVAQRIRNASAVGRAKQKIARERLGPVRPPR